MYHSTERKGGGEEEFMLGAVFERPSKFED